MPVRFRACAIAGSAAMIFGCAAAPEPPAAAAPARNEPAVAPAEPGPGLPAASGESARTAAYAAARAALGDVARFRYVGRGCPLAEIPDPAYAGFDVRRCAYEEGGLAAVVYVLDAPAEAIALWVANACAAVGRGEDARCATGLVARMRGSNSFIFPVAGDVLEPASSAGRRCGARYGEATVHAFFRDGVTVETARGYTCETYAISTADAEAEAFRPPVAVYDVARIAALDRDDYARLMDVPRPGDDEWRAIVRDSYLDALGTGRYSLLELAARLTP